jgi:DNA-binding transcriptional LysR family regulator
MDYRDEVFLCAADKLSFSKAAEALNISQPAVTKHIKELESALNCSLFDRNNSRVRLSESGLIAYERLRQIKNMYMDLDFELGRVNKTFRGALRLGASSTVAQYLIPPALAAFKRRFPDIKINLLNGNSFDMENALLNNEIDLALVENLNSRANIKYSPFYDDEIVAVCGADRAYSKLQTISARDLTKIPIILREEGSGTLEVIKKTLADKKIDFAELDIPIHLGSSESIKNYLCNFDGIALISELAIDKEIRLKSLVKIKIKDIGFHRKFRIAALHGHEAQTAKLFADYIASYNF